MRQRPYVDGHVALPINGRPAVAVATPLWVPRSADPAGGIWATTRDVLRYGRFHFAAETIAGPANIVSPNSLRQNAGAGDADSGHGVADDSYGRRPRCHAVPASRLDAVV
jgi:hypothetical protein